MIHRAILAAIRRGLLAAAVLTAVGCAYQVVRSGSVDTGKVDKIKSGLEQVRQLRFLKPVPLVVESREQAQRDIEAQLTHQISDAQFEIDGRTGSLIGLYPSGIDLKRQTLKLLDDQVAGFYDPDTKRMILVSGMLDTGLWDDATEFLMQRDVVGEMVLAHELTHALQDQHFNLSGKLDAVKNNDDREIALKSVAEGDATLSGFAYVVGGMNQVELNTVVNRLSDLPAMFAKQAKWAPEGLRAPLIFQYSAGVRFVADAYRRGGWGAVDALYRHPPQSSQQIMHPGLYYDHPTPPAEITVAGYRQALRGWTKADEDCEGELGLSVILKQAFGEDASQVAFARAWTGDRLLSLTRGSELSVLWMIRFGNERSAAGFAAAYTEALDRRYPMTIPHRVDYEAKMVLVVIGEAARSFPRLEEPVFAQSKVRFLPAPYPVGPAAIQASVPVPSSRVLAFTMRSRSLR